MRNGEDDEILWLREETAKYSAQIETLRKSLSHSSPDDSVPVDRQHFVAEDDAVVDRQGGTFTPASMNEKQAQDTTIMPKDDGVSVTSGQAIVCASGKNDKAAKKTDSAVAEDTDGDEPPRKPNHSSEKRETVLQAARSEALRPFVIISSSYLLFTVTDGAIRMIVLLHAYNQSFSALQVAIMFTLYELAGVFTNLAAGFLGAKWGIKFTLIVGLALQLFSYGLLFGWQEDWSQQAAIVYVTVAQMFAGIAKDLTKLGGKTVTKLVTPEEQETRLFKLVSLITGWKNSLKGVGYFLGSALIQVNYFLALGVMMALVALAMPWAILGLSKDLGTAKNKNAKWHDVFKMDNKNLNWLSLARLFLFASRDFWFEVPLPFFLRSPICEGLGTQTCDAALDDSCQRGAVCDAVHDVCASLNTGGGCGGLGLERVVVGAFLGGYIILYGQVQSWTPQLVTGPLHQTPPNKRTAIFWGVINCIPTLVMCFVLAVSDFYRYPTQDNFSARIAWLVSVVVSFAVIFAINSSIHSFLVVNYAKKDKVAVSVGFYYMSNAMGRLFGTLGSGILYTYVGDYVNEFAGTDAVPGMAACFAAGTISSLVAAVITLKIEEKGGLKCGSCWTIIPYSDPVDTDAQEKSLQSKLGEGGDPTTGPESSVEFATIEEEIRYLRQSLQRNASTIESMKRSLQA